MKKKLKDIRDSWIFEKVRVKATKSVSGKGILLKFVRETRTKSPYLPSKVTLEHLFTSFCVVTKRRNMPCQSLEIWQVVQQDNQPPEPKEQQETRRTTRTRGTTIARRTTRTRRTRKPRELGTRRGVYMTKSDRRNVTSAMAITLETSLFLRWLLNFSSCL